MSALDRGEVRGFYRALGIELPLWAQREAPVRCFAAPEDHAHRDRNPSTSVNLLNGAWCCHGCGACGGAYDAALALGLTPRHAIELMIQYDLLQPRDARHTREGWTRRTPLRAVSGRAQPTRADAAPQLAVGEDDLRRWQASLANRPELLAQLACERGWRYPVMRELEIGLDAGRRLTIPIRSQTHTLQGVLRYHPWHTREPKMLAVPGTRLGLIPHPSLEPSGEVLLVEGPPDMLAARSRGLAAIAVPGTHAWRAQWAGLLAGRRVTIVMDCDRPGREAAQRIACDLAGICDVRVVDLDPGREDGYDLTQALGERPGMLATDAGLARLQRLPTIRRDENARGVQR